MLNRISFQDDHFIGIFIEAVPISGNPFNLVESFSTFFRLGSKAMSLHAFETALHVFIFETNWPKTVSVQMEIQKIEPEFAKRFI